MPLSEIPFRKFPCNWFRWGIAIQKQVIGQMVCQNLGVERCLHAGPVDQALGHLDRQHRGTIGLDSDVAAGVRRPVGDIDPLPLDLPIQAEGLFDGLEHRDRENDRHSSATLHLQQVGQQRFELILTEALNMYQSDIRGVA